MWQVIIMYVIDIKETSLTSSTEIVNNFILIFQLFGLAERYQYTKFHSIVKWLSPWRWYYQYCRLYEILEIIYWGLTSSYKITRYQRYNSRKREQKIRASMQPHYRKIDALFWKSDDYKTRLYKHDKVKTKSFFWFFKGNAKITAENLAWIWDIWQKLA